MFNISKDKLFEAGIRYLTKLARIQKNFIIVMTNLI